MNKFTPHIPNCVDTTRPPLYEYKDMEEFWNIDWIVKRRNNPKFVKFSLSKNSLIVHYNDDTYWVVGHIEGELPEGLVEFQSIIGTDKPNKNDDIIPAQVWKDAIAQYKQSAAKFFIHENGVKKEITLHEAGKRGLL